MSRRLPQSTDCSLATAEWVSLCVGWPSGCTRCELTTCGCLVVTWGLSLLTASLPRKLQPCTQPLPLKIGWDYQGCHWSGKFKVREKSGNFVIGQGNLEFWEKSGNFGIGQGNLTFSCLTCNNAAMPRIRKKCWCQNYSTNTWPVKSEA